jgi:nitric oxide reductase NorE protein
VTTPAAVERPRLPGVDGVWVLIGADSVVFALLFASFLQARLADPAAFEATRQTLNADVGGLNTVILLTSSWAVASAVQALRGDHAARAQRWFLMAVLTGLAFVVLKSGEYVVKLADGVTPASSDFSMWYFVLTGIHLVHVLLGLGLLTHVLVRIRRGGYGSTRMVVPECVASFWHLVDLLWIVLFPLLYLMRAA